MHRRTLPEVLLGAAIIVELIALPSCVPSRNKCLKSHDVSGITFNVALGMPMATSDTQCDLYIRVDEKGQEIPGTVFRPDGTAVVRVLR